MAIERKAWGTLAGRDYSVFTIRNAAGASLVVSDYGARALQMNVPSPAGVLADIILGFDAIESYRDSPAYFGATAGRFANRLRRGRFTLDGHDYQVRCNEGLNALHGGVEGFDRKAWEASYDAGGDTVTFSLVSPHGDEGFPGKLSVTSAFTLTDDQRIRHVIKARTDRPTLCNIVHHSYFNLAGHATGNVLDQELQVEADFYTPVDDELIITGEVLKVANTPFDFRAPHPIRDRIHEVPNGGAGRLPEGAYGGYDHNWCLRGEPGRLRRVLTARDPVSGRGFELHTTEPGVHIYTGGYLNAAVIGKGNQPYQRFSGFTIETQKFPDGPNLSHVPQSRLDPGLEYLHIFELRILA